MEAAAIVAGQRDDRRLDDRDAERLHARELIRAEAVRTVAEQDDIVGPLAQQDREVFAAGAAREDGDPLVAALEAVAVRASACADSPALGKAGTSGPRAEHARGAPHGPRPLHAAAEVPSTVPPSTSASRTSAATPSGP